MINRRVVGNILIVLSFLLLVFIYYPVIQLYFFPPSTSKEEIVKIKTYPFSIEISKIGVISKVIENVDPSNETEYRQKLKEGIAHAKGTAVPGKKGTIFLFAHSSDVPWSLTRYNVPFFRLGELNNGDEIIIVKNKRKYTYRVFDKKTVWPNEIGYLKDISEDKLILQTCTPVGTDIQRLLVFARLKK